MKYEMLFSGIGGQGIMVLGETLCNIAIKAGYQVTFVPFYGQEKRGGRTMCNIVIADGMESPIISEAQLMLVMDERSMQEYEWQVAKGGTMLINSSMIDMEPTRDDYTAKRLPFNDVATKEVGNAKTANIIALGAVLRHLSFLTLEQAEEEVKASFAAKPKLIPMNIEALHKGYELGA